MLEDFHRSLTPENVSAKFADLIAEVGTLAPVDMPLRHHFAPGIYARELTLPEGAVVVSKINKYPLLMMISKGQVSLLAGGDLNVISAPATVTLQPGVQRAMYANEEAVMTVLHPTRSTDLVDIERIFIAQTEADYAEFLLEQQALRH